MSVEHKVAVLQSNYIPWKGYFDLISEVDTLVIYDDVQFTKNDWRNRNQIKTMHGMHWLSVPVGQKISRNINEVKIPEHKWQKKHWNTIAQNYRKQDGYSEFKDFFENFYLENQWSSLSEMNQFLIENICKFLGIETNIIRSEQYAVDGAKEERLLSLLKKVEATEYVTGPAGLDYINPENFKQASISLTAMKYGPYHQYDQPHGEFVNAVSVVDLLLCCGSDSKNYFKSKN